MSDPLEEYARTIGVGHERKLVPDAEYIGGMREETDDEFRTRLKAIYQTKPQGGSVGSIMYAVHKAVPMSVRTVFTQKRSRNRNKCGVFVRIVEYDPRPWWQFWGAS